jgi:hypothetical protein
MLLVRVVTGEARRSPKHSFSFTSTSDQHDRSSNMVNESKTHEAASSVRSTPVLDCLDPNAHYGDFRDDLNRDGYAVIKGVLPVQRCNEYIDQIHEWLESFNLGYNRNDPSTVKEECLPIIHQKGLIQAYGAPHENFTWGVRSEPAIIDVFATLFGTQDLLTSFDAVNVSLANRKDLPANKAWAHQDQG